MRNLRRDDTRTLQENFLKNNVVSVTWTGEEIHATVVENCIFSDRLTGEVLFGILHQKIASKIKLDQEIGKLS